MWGNCTGCGGVDMVSTKPVEGVAGEDEIIQVGRADIATPGAFQGSCHTWSGGLPSLQIAGAATDNIHVASVSSS